ncbi:hypothetical protein [Paenibacillus lutimineralis]|uniref:Uncharacterized protein n=1 Tax=Paenibacillus lutimineralis TaxID=2707005 RepID=A0A3Q9I7M7_9BACL|nr:hypothetical protein [Paenibacillus lutimineralis]AZS14326.1 hypothetical protein EI981_07550 [Paenibacillus lutimineralis]
MKTKRNEDEIFIRDVYLYTVKDFGDLKECFPELTNRGSNVAPLRLDDFLYAYYHINLFVIFAKRSNLLREHINIFENKYKAILDPLKLTQKKFINYLFENDFSENLMEIEIEREDLYDFFDTDFFIGSCINYTSTYKKILNDEEINIKFLKMQPLNSKFTISLINSNLIHFSNDIEKSEAIKLMDQFQLQVENYGGFNENNIDL